MSSGIDKVEEKFARAVVGQVMGANVSRADDRHAPAGTVDGRLEYSSGRVGALEISTLGLPHEFEAAMRIEKLGGRPPMPGRWKWVITITNPDDIRRILRIYEKVISVCEEHDAVRIEELPASVVGGDRDLTWLWEKSSSSFFGIELPAGAQDLSGYIDLRYRPAVVGWLSGPDQIVVGVNAALAVDPLAKRVAKLARAAGDERHLFLRVASSGLEETAFVRLMQHSMAPSDAGLLEGEPDLPEGIDYLWLLTGWGQRVSRWTRGVGWDHPVFG